MEHTFWHERWQHNQIGFHESEVQGLLTAHWQALGVADGARVFVPLCGKSLDMHWLHDRGYEVLGVELSELACEAFFAEAGLEPTKGTTDAFTTFDAQRYRLLCGDVFALTEAHLKQVTAVYDRAALIALPPAMRQRYAEHLVTLLRPGTEILLITIEFDVAGFDSPPFAVIRDEVDRLFGAHCDIALLETGPTTVKGHAGTHSALRLTVR